MHTLSDGSVKYTIRPEMFWCYFDDESDCDECDCIHGLHTRRAGIFHREDTKDSWGHPNGHAER